MERHEEVRRMSDERDQSRHEPPDEALPSVHEVANLDAFLDRLVQDQRPDAGGLTEQEMREHLLAAQLRLARDGVEEPSPAFLEALEKDVGRAVAAARPRGRRVGFSRGRFLRSAAVLASGAGLGAAGVEAASAWQDSQRPHELIEVGQGRWYAIAAVGEVQPGGSKLFAAGGVLGYLLNTDGQLHAVSAVCTHMGCLVKPAGPAQAAELACLCHGSRFDRHGAVLAGRAPSALPAITLRIEGGKVFALGSRETA
jgi:Rieske Fe-S protein